MNSAMFLFRFACIAYIVNTTAAIAAPAPLRIMPIGDSITAGDTTANGVVNSGYRAGLYTKLTNDHVPFTFVGTHSEGTPSAGQAQPGYPDLAALGQGKHEGYGGEGTQFVLDNLYKQDNTGFLQVDKPDIILLQIGINDINGIGGDLTQIEPRLNSIVSTIIDHSSAKVIVAQISGYTDYNQLVVDYNKYIKNTLVPSYAGTGRVTTVDQYSNFIQKDAQGNYLYDTNHHEMPDASLFSQAPHPNQIGYDRMALTWAAGVEAAVPEPTSLAAVAMGAAVAIKRPARKVSRPTTGPAKER